MQQNQGKAKAQLDDKSMLNDMLNTEKQLVGVYASFLCECAAPDARQIFSGNLNQTAQDQYQTFKLMQQKGWYQLEQAEAQKINQARQALSQVKSEL